MIIKCKMCGGDLHPAENATTCACEFCGTMQTIPKLDSDRRLNLYDRANHFRRNNEYDKAMGIFEQILQDDRTDAEAYWSLVLCRYGIEYVEDPATGRRVPTVNRAQYTSILADDDYKSALQYADSVQRAIYEEEAGVIDGIQKGILAISRKEKPFDVFICYKETDAEGRRTPDSVLANDLYHQLTREGFKVFFSRITLEDKLGQQYEPYIFAALNSAKVMVVLGTKPEYFNAVWVKNEWSRFLALIRAGADKTLVPAYRDMDPYDLPEEFSHLQAQDMSKLGFMQDLIRGIRKLARPEAPQAAPTVVVQSDGTAANVQSLLGRAFMALEDGDFAKADEFCEQALNLDFQNARAYLGKLMAELHVRREADLSGQPRPLEHNGHYQKALRFADKTLKAELTGWNEAIIQRNRQQQQAAEYAAAMALLDRAGTVEAVEGVKARIAALGDDPDAAQGLRRCDEKLESLRAAAFDRANALMAHQRYGQAAAAFRALGSYRDSEAAAVKCDQLEARRQAEIAEANARQARENAERRAREEAERRERERVEAELQRRKDEIARREAEARAAKTRKIVILLTAVAAVCIAAFLVVTKVVLPRQQYNQAMRAMQEGQYDAAIQGFLALDGYADSESRILQAQANQAYEAGDLSYVLALYADLPAAYQDHADDFSAMYSEAVALMDAGSYDEAIALYNVLGDYRDSRALAMQAGADQLYDGGDLAGAYDIYATLDEAYQSHAADYAAAYNAAEAARVSGDYSGAYAQFLALGGYADAQAKAGQCLVDNADALFAGESYAEAAEAYTLLGDTDKASEATYRYAAQLAEQGEYLLAAQQYEGIMAYKDSRAQHFQLAATAREHGLYADTLAILTGDPDHPDAAEALYQTGVSASAAQDYETSVAAFTQVGAYRDASMKLTMDTYALGGQLYSRGEYDRAAEVYASMGNFSDAPERAYIARYAAADAAMLAGDYADAAQRFTALGDYSDSRAKARECDYLPARALHEAGQYASALEAFTAAGLSGYSDSDTLMNDCRYQLGQAAAAQGDYKDALAWYEAAGSYLDSSAQADACRRQIALAAGQACEAQGDYAQAFAQYGLAGETDRQQEMAYQAGMAKLTASDYAGALDWLWQAGTYGDTQAQILAIGEYYYTTQQYDQAEAVFARVPEAGSAAQRLYELGQYYELDGNMERAVQAYREAGDYADAADKVTVIQQDLDYLAAEKLYQADQLEDALALYQQVSGYKDADDQAAAIQLELTYRAAEAQYQAMEWESAQALYAQIPGYRDANSKAQSCIDRMKLFETYQQHYAESYEGSVAAGSYHTVGLKRDGTVVAVGENSSHQCDVSGWTDIVAVAAGYDHTVGLKRDGTVVAVGSIFGRQCNVSGWTDIVAVAARNSHTVGLKRNGSVVAVGSNSAGQCDVSGWTDIVAVAAGYYHTVGLKRD
ncbi:MAG: TIR domain-containing protein, partial [Aristaeellaceae bacterium]